MTEIDVRATKYFVKHFGKENQQAKAIEELDELKEAIKTGNAEHIAEEIADVYIMLNQLRIIFDINDAFVESTVQYKIERTFFRIKQEEEKCQYRP